MPEINLTNLPGVFSVKHTVFEDFRGQYIELWHKEQFDGIIEPFNNGKRIEFVEDDISITERHCLKGVHSDTKAWKLISCLYGKFYLVVINYDTESEHYGKWQGFTLSDTNKMQILIPPKHGNGHLCLSEKSIFHYKQSEQYDLSRQSTIPYNDQRFKIFWPIKDPIVSMRDLTGDQSFTGK